MGIIGIAGLICSLVSLILIVIAIAIPYWERNDTDLDGNMYVGLWMNCTRHYGKEAICSHLNTVEGVFMLIGAIVYSGRRSGLSPGESINYHAGFGFAIIAGGTALFSGILHMAGRSNHTNKIKGMN
ncbi:hypothetical protein ACJMK2_003366 [Sinanodonta woodiana]|uniref:Uncharacterized protein n=1 Tax=Sinanodonta woodiana TaxID=1069815 RepID=A0ABD3Y1E0_SINWO